jgi:hypothetical protein
MRPHKPLDGQKLRLLISLIAFSVKQPRARCKRKID